MSKRKFASIGLAAVVSCAALVVALSSIAPASREGKSRVTLHFRETAHLAVLKRTNGWPFPGGKATGIARFTSQIKEDPEHPTEGMFIRKITITEQTSPTTFKGHGVGRNYTPHGVQRVKLSYLLELLPGGGVSFHGRARLLNGTCRYRHARGVATYRATGPDPNSPFTEYIRGRDSFDPRDECR